MPISNAIFQNGFNFAEGAQILNPLIQEISDMVEAEVGLKDQAAKYGVTMHKVLTPSGVITSLIGPDYLDEIDEDGEAPSGTVMQGYDKGYGLKTYGKKFKLTKLFLEWLKAAQTISGADASVKAELQKFRDNVIYLMRAAVRTVNREIALLYANGFTATGAAFGPGSPGGDGVALFANNHPIKATGGTYSNLLGSALSAASLEAAIQSYKTGVYAQSGFRIDTPEIFTLLVPRALETAARKILNSSGDQAGIYAGSGSNANLMNVFSFNGSKVQLEVLDILGEQDGKGGKIGGTNADNMWFLLNKPYALEVGAFRMLKLWDNEVETWYDPETSSTYTKVTAHWGVDHYNPECVMGYPGA